MKSDERQKIISDLKEILDAKQLQYFTNSIEDISEDDMKPILEHWKSMREALGPAVEYAERIASRYSPAEQTLRPVSRIHLTRGQIVEAYRRMRTIRELEERIHNEFADRDIPSFVHLY